MDHEIISRAEAKERGLKFYFTGKQCKKGGIAQRRVSSRDCLCDECVKALNAKHRSMRELNPNRNKEYAAKLRKENPEKVKEYKRNEYQKNKDKISARVSQWQKDNHEHFLNRKRLWVKSNPGKARTYKATRRASKKQAIPSWFGEFDQFVIEQAYSLAAQREAETGIEWHVDHMIPLRARKASGLHCACNIQVIPAAMNLSKGNKMILTEPLAWLR